jgi:hypothetical protein
MQTHFGSSVVPDVVAYIATASGFPTGAVDDGLDGPHSEGYSAYRMSGLPGCHDPSLE